MKLTTRTLNGGEATLGGSLGVFPFVFIQEYAAEEPATFET